MDMSIKRNKKYPVHEEKWYIPEGLKVIVSPRLDENSKDKQPEKEMPSSSEKHRKRRDDFE